MTDQPPYAVRVVESAQPPRHSYEVYNAETDEPIIRFQYSRTKQSRSKAQARANLYRNTLNWKWLKQRHK